VSHHFSAEMLKFPDGDARLDLTDLFAFRSPDSPGKTVLIQGRRPHRAPGRPALRPRSAGYFPNGRVLTDDVYDMRMAFLTHGRVTSDGVGPHDDYLPEFPFLGLPNEPDGHTSFLASDLSA
jgi:hypothetical protein